LKIEIIIKKERKESDKEINNFNSNYQKREITFIIISIIIVVVVVIGGFVIIIRIVNLKITSYSIKL
jgi:uncharacterized Tic20 family protein